MALKGSLEDFSIAQLLGLVTLAKKTGLLTLSTDLDSAHLYFKNGRLVHLKTTHSDGRLVSVLLQANKLRREQATKIEDQPESRDDTQLGRLLADSGWVTRDDIVHAVRQYMLGVVDGLMHWHGGAFEFVPDVAVPSDRLSVPLHLGSMVIEHTRRLRENERLEDELPDLDKLSLRFASNSDVRMQSVNLTVEEWRVISFINPRNTIKQIAEANNMDGLQVRRIVKRLLEAGLVELMETGEMAALGSGANRPSTADSLGIKRSVIERLVGRIQGV